MPNSGFNAATRQSDEWETPAWLFDALDHEFAFTLDGAATSGNALCKKFNAADAPVAWNGERVFCNPPYSDIETFVRRAFVAELCVLLLPVRTDSDWFRLLVERDATIRWMRKRVRFLENGVVQSSPRFASLVAIVRDGAARKDGAR
jgi:phage N-6-adenine-methyltransferase